MNKDGQSKKIFKPLYTLLSVATVMLCLSLVPPSIYLKYRIGSEYCAALILNSVYPVIQVSLDIFSLFAVFNSPETLIKLKGLDLLFSGVMSIAFCVVSGTDPTSIKLTDDETFDQGLKIFICSVYGVIAILKMCQLILLNKEIVDNETMAHKIDAEIIESMMTAIPGSVSKV
ncbi:hypothetical protein BdWA1_001717 [Babesia duncani]|uniref:Uncharacterized protein n=1 Tax=Babesia duncani TaxID=323732 RepID=A0AAD9PKE6_9APIC|nr:hypothetical protein BdWA1_001717 [Babesia duncani]